MSSEYRASRNEINRRKALSKMSKILIGVVATTAIGTSTYVLNQQRGETNLGNLTVYSGRGESLVGSIINNFETETGIKPNVRYAGSAELALTILEEGMNSPADIFFSQDAGALSALSKESRLLTISDKLLQKVKPQFRSSKGEWVGITGRVRTVDYNVNLVKKEDLPESIWGFIEPKWKGNIGWAPTNGSFQSFITAFRKIEGEEKTREWLLGIIDNDPQIYPKNSPIVEALGRGEIQVGFVNNYYLHRFKANNPEFPVAHHYTINDAGSMVNISGIGIINTTRNKELCEQFIEYMLSNEVQNYFVSQTHEYPLTIGSEMSSSRRNLEQISIPNLDLNELDDLEGTLNLLREVEAFG